MSRILVHFGEAVAAAVVVVAAAVVVVVVAVVVEAAVVFLLFDTKIRRFADALVGEVYIDCNQQNFLYP